MNYLKFSTPMAAAAYSTQVWRDRFGTPSGTTTSSMFPSIALINSEWALLVRNPYHVPEEDRGDLVSSVILLSEQVGL